MARILLTIVGLSYVALAGWCAMRPHQTSNSIGLALRPGSGESEYFTVYGGLQLGLGLLFLWPLLRNDTTPTMLAACLVIHAAILVFRLISFTLFSGVQSTTFVFAGIEATILVATAAVWWLNKSS